MKFTKNFLILSLLICVGLHSSFPVDGEVDKSRLRKKRIINGLEAELGQFPYMVSIRYMERQECTGALISDRSVLTAAHCVVDPRSGTVFSTHYFDGLLGSVHKRDTANRMAFKEFRVHEQYRIKSMANDIAILILNERVETNNHVKTIALPEKGIRFDGEVVTAVGWGKNKFRARCGSSTLRYMESRVAESDNVCSSRSANFDPNKNICLEQKEEICVFEGDSGSPLVKISFEIHLSIGVLFGGFSESSCSSLPAIYMSTSAYHDWIKQNVVGEATFVDVISL